MEDRLKLRVMIAESNATVAQALELYLSFQPGLKVLARVARVNAMFAALDEVQPDVLLLDWEMPGWTPRSDMQALLKVSPKLRIVAMGTRLESERNALALGAHVFVGKTQPVGDLINAISGPAIADIV